LRAIHVLIHFLLLLFYILYFISYFNLYDRLQLAYNWFFKVDKTNQEDGAKVFAVRDFVGDLCSTVASIIRGAVASVDFDTFHKTSARLIRKAVFGVDESGKINKEYFLSKNNAVITSVDIQSVEPIDDNTRENLQKTVALAIEITTKRQEALARHNAEKLDQEAVGELEKMKIEDQAKAESQRKNLLELQAQSESVKIQGVAIAEAKAKAEGNEIFYKSKLQNVQLITKAKKILDEAKLGRSVKKQNVILNHEIKTSALDIDRNRKLAEIESKKFEEMIATIGQETIVAIAQAGPEMEAQLLGSLGLKGFIMTDGNNPINLFNTANGLIGNAPENENN